MEWHEMCGYDRLHIFTGSIKNFEKTNRIARFCGPKAPWTKPFDGQQPNHFQQKLSYFLGARKLRNLEVDGVRELAMWDKPYETMTNQIIIAFDLDDDFSHLKGFKLK